MTLVVGSSFDRYTILSLLGKGGMGEVYLAQDTRLRRKIALKLLPAQFTQERDRVRRFEQEAYAASALNHPNIITIHETGEVDGIHFIATEFIDGQTLRERMRRSRLTLLQTLDVSAQMASALAEAHGAGIIHRDIKPENVMIRADGVVKVLDFGLAKLSEHRSPTPDNEPSTTAETATLPGTVMGTAQYMSPEQARAQAMDGRTDIFSLGVVLYEMIAGRAPFEGSTPSDMIAAILKTEPPLLARYSAEVPRELDHIVTKALRKNRDERYQNVKDLLIDLKDLRQELELEAKLARTEQAAPRGESKASEPKAVEGAEHDGYSTAILAAGNTGEGSKRTTSSVEYIVSRLKQHKKSVGLIVTVLLVVAAAAIYYLSFRRGPTLTEKDTVLLADFVNTTGDAVFDGSLKQGLSVHLGQTPFLNILPQDRVRQTLRLMGKSPDERVTREVAREICERQGLKALIIGSIASLGSTYLLTLEAVNSQNGEVLAWQQAEASGKEQVLRSLGEAASRLREGLGEPLSSIQKHNVRLAQATTSSLEALKALSQATDHGSRGRYAEAIPFLKRATELDPKFAIAYSALSAQYGNSGQSQLAAEAIEKAFALRDRVSEREKRSIEFGYYTNATGELEKVIEMTEMAKHASPRSMGIRSSLTVHLLRLGQYEKVIEEAREIMRLDPNFRLGHANLLVALFRLGRFDEAKAVHERAVAQKRDGLIDHRVRYVIAFFQNDDHAMRQELDWMGRNSSEEWALDLQSGTAGMRGQFRQAQTFSRRAVELAARRNLNDIGAAFAASRLLNEASCGQCRQVKQDAAQVLAMSRAVLAQVTVPVLPSVAFALALCGEVGEAQKLVDEIVRKYPKSTQANTIFLPVLRGAIEQERGHADQAIQLLEAATIYESAAWWWPNYARGNSYLRLRQGGAAAAEFQKILDHPGRLSHLSTFHPMAHLGLARAAAIAGDQSRSRKAYEDFLALWKDADRDLPILIQARKEYEKLP